LTIRFSINGNKQIKGSEHIKFISLFFVVLLAFGCTSKLDKQVLELVEGKNLWQEKVQAHNYSYDLVTRCSCSDSGKTIRVVSSQAEVISAAYVEGLSIRGIRHLKNMKQLYEQILDHLQEQESSKSASVDVEYNSELGYPTMISYDGSAMDIWYIFEISNVQIIKE